MFRAVLVEPHRRDSGPLRRAVIDPVWWRTPVTESQALRLFPHDPDTTSERSLHTPPRQASGSMYRSKARSHVLRSAGRGRDGGSVMVRRTIPQVEPTAQVVLDSAAMCWSAGHPSGGRREKIWHPKGRG